MSNVITSLPKRQYAGLWIGLILAAIYAIITPIITDEYWLGLLTFAVIFSVAAAGVGVLYGRLGMVSLNQVALLGFGGWFYLRFAHMSDAIPAPVLLVIAGVCTMILGTLIGLPALRLSGLNLALVTLMFAAFAGVFFDAYGFPRGNEGWRGQPAELSAAGGSENIARPSYLVDSRSMWFFIVVVSVIMFLILWFFLKGRAGRAWAAIRQSEPGAASVGVNITGNKMLALAIVSFTTGVAGGLLAIPNGRLDPLSFVAVNSIVLFAVVLIGGAFSLVGAVIAGLLSQAFPPLLEYIVKTIPPLYNTLGAAFTNLILVLFGAGLIQALATSPKGMAGNFAPIGQVLNLTFTKNRNWFTYKFLLILVIIPPILGLAFGAATGIELTLAMWIAIYCANLVRGTFMDKGTSKPLFWIVFAIAFLIPVAIMFAGGTFTNGPTRLSNGIYVDPGLFNAAWFMFILWLILVIAAKIVRTRRLNAEQAAAREMVNA